MSVPAPQPQETTPAPITPQFPAPTRYIIGVMMFLFGIFLILLIRPVLTTLLFAFIIAFVLYLPARALARHTPLSFAAAVIAIYLAIVIILMVLFFTLLPAIIDGVNTLVDDVQVAYEQVADWILAYEPDESVISIFGRDIKLDPLVQVLTPFFTGESSLLASGDVPIGEAADGISLPNRESEMPTFLAVAGSAVEMIGIVAGAAVDVFTSIASMVAVLAISLFISFLALLDLGNGGGIGHFVGSRYRREVQILFSRLDRIWLGFFKSQVLIGLILGVMAYIQFILFGVPGALPLAIFNGFFSVIPTVGGLISVIPLVIVSLLLGSTRFTEMDHITFMLLNLIVQTIYSQLVYNVISPPLVGKSVKLPVIVVIVGVLIGMALGGILAAFLVVPIISTMKLMFSYLLAKVGMQEPFPGESPPEAKGFFAQIASESGVSVSE
ncbi:MAG: AI-2E family transporter [Anaerolineae bacterium]|nr:AI-2E family transporter [Anaerolineae bacterium]